ncbi:MAG: hypothetical protein R3C12_06215 [Planctomycetaceae bacterium]
MFASALTWISSWPGLGIPAVALSAEVRMKCGYVIRFEGKPVPVQGLTIEQIRQGTPGPVESFPFTMFDAVSRRYYLSQSQVEEVQLGSEYIDEFKLQVKPSARMTMFGSVGGFVNMTPFSEYGRRIVTLQGTDKPIDVVQSISRIRPDYVDLTAINVNWQYAIATKTLPPVVLRQSLSHAINEQSHEDRLAVVRLFVDAEYYREAQQELDRIAQDFPDLKARVDQLQLEVRQLRALQFANEFERRLEAGQFELVSQQARQFPREDINQATLQRIDRMQQQHAEAREQMDQARAQLSRLQSEVRDPALLARFQDMRSLVEQRLTRTTLERLSPFLNSLEDPTLDAVSKLALAYTGWVVGPALAEPDADTALNLWDARDLVLEILRGSSGLRRTELVAQLKATENVSPDIVSALVRHLEPVHETAAEAIGTPMTLNTLEAATPVTYDILLPAEYSPDRKYPLVLALPAGGISPQQTLVWWGGASLAGPAHRNGYIVISPHAPAGADASPPGETLAMRVVQVLRDARKRFGIDSDRVFLVGHGQGGDAVFDIGMSHPDLFAGAVVFTGRTNEYTTHYWENSRHLPFYVVVGELDADNFKQNANDMTRMMKNRFDVVLTEFKQRGREDYYEELPLILEWMRLHRRAPLPSVLEMKTLRPSDNRFYWLEIGGLPEQIMKPRTNRQGDPLPPRPLPLTAKVTAGNTLYLTVGAERISLWLSPEFVSFEEKLKVQWKGRTMFNQIPERDIGVMLEHLRITGDRERLYWMNLNF